MCDLINLNKKIIKNGKEENYSDLSKLKKIEEYLKENTSRSRILIMGINPAEHGKEIKNTKLQDQIHVEYIENYDELDKEKKKKLKNLVNVSYFKGHYDLFKEGSVQLSWTVIDDCVNELKKLNIEEKIDTQKPLLIFADLFYYHQTKQKEIEEIIDEEEKKNKKELYKIIKEIIIKHIDMFNPNLIIVTNAYAAKLLYRVYNNGNKDYSNDLIEENGVNILLSGAVTGQGTMDVFSKARLKARIQELLKKNKKTKKLEI